MKNGGIISYTHLRGLIWINQVSFMMSQNYLLNARKITSQSKTGAMFSKRVLIVIILESHMSSLFCRSWGELVLVRDKYKPHHTCGLVVPSNLHFGNKTNNSDSILQMENEYMISSLYCRKKID